jgi:hypothetical protein
VVVVGGRSWQGVYGNSTHAYTFVRWILGNYTIGAT